MVKWAAGFALAIVASVVPAVAASAQVPPGPYVSILFGRAMWAQSEGCQIPAGQPNLYDIASHLRARGIRATGVTVPARTAEAGVQCFNGNLYPSWQELAAMRDVFGWSFVSNGYNRVDITQLSPAAQYAESCGSLEAYEAHGHNRAWGMYGPGTNRITQEISTNLISTCFGFTRFYGNTSINTQAKATSPPYYALTDDTSGGDCATGPCTGSSGTGKAYRTPARIIPQFQSAKSNEWVVFSTYKLVTGSRLTGSRRWDCTSPDENKHWTNEVESYCLVDFLKVLDAIKPGSLVTDPADVAQRWGRVPPRPAQSPASGTFQPLPNPLRGFGEFFPLAAPERILDTRQTRTPVIGGQVRRVQVTGLAGVPPDANQVALNVTVVDPTVAGWLAVTPAGAPPPNVSNLNFGTGQTVPNLVTARVGAGGQLDITLSAGAAHVLFDVVGWFGSGQTAAAGAKVTTQAPVRRLDTRQAGPAGRVGQGGVIGVQVVPPNSGVTGVIMNLTGTGPTASTYITAYPSDQPRPNASSLNLVAGQTKPNLVMLRVPPSGVVNLYNFAGSVDLIVDLVGTYRPAGANDDSVGGRLLPLITPLRLVDSRRDDEPLGGPGSMVWNVGALEAEAGRSIRGLVLNLTATRATAPTYLTLFPGGTPLPLASNLNVMPGTDVPNLAVADLSASNTVSIYNDVGRVDYIFDLAAVILG
jgi:hypothetical protein